MAVKDLSQNLNLNIPNQISNLWILDTYNDLILLLETIIVIRVLLIIFNLWINWWNQNFTHWIFIEFVWTLRPVIILIILGIPSIKMLYIIEFQNFCSRLNLKIVGHQWFWEYSFPEFNICLNRYPKISSDLFRLGERDLIVLPYKTSIRLLVTSRDVIHSWTVPSLGLKIDANPGRLNFIRIFALSRGKYIGQCSELCGAYHSWIPIYLETTTNLMFSNFLKRF